MTASLKAPQQTQTRVFIRLAGRVQGVGFRPFVYRLAQKYRLHGQVANVGGEVHIDAQGKDEDLQEFQSALFDQAPTISRPQLVSRTKRPLHNVKAFVIAPSSPGLHPRIHVPPDYFTCDDCLSELSNKNDRRYAYPFINCTQCGPRYSIIDALPYDRVNTSMAEFSLCLACGREYNNPGDRRYHAEPLACAECGPELRFKTPLETVSQNDAALLACVNAIKGGVIIAVKGIGGYHLCCDAQNADAIKVLRQLKNRPQKPLALLFPQEGSDGVQGIRQYAQLDAAQAQLLMSPMRPILLVDKLEANVLASNIAPGLDQIGVMLPYSPLHHLLLQNLQRPIVATSANISGEPVITDNKEVEARLAHVTGHFLHHNRVIRRPVDDSVFRVVAKKARPLRLGRGIAPLELSLGFTLAQPLLACGGHLKNTVALAFDDRVVISPHIGDMGSVRSQAVFETVVKDLQSLYQVDAQILICDAHPQYQSTRWAQSQTKPVQMIYHHHAHAACLPGEFPQAEKWLVFTWDGVGYGNDGSLWGGETLFGKAGQWKRVVSMRRFRLPGGDQAARHPWRSALGMCHAAAIRWQPEFLGHTVETQSEWELVTKALQRGINSPYSSAVGRIFDAVAALLGVCADASYEGQAPMLLETLARQAPAGVVDLPLNVGESKDLLRVDWAPLLHAVLNPALKIAEAAYLLHTSLAHNVLKQSLYMRDIHGDFAVGLCGGVFQNKLLTELAMEKLEQAGFSVFVPEKIPLNDGGLCFGQIIEAAALLGNQGE